MSLRDFWINARQGMRLFAPRTTVDSPKFEVRAIESALRGTNLWLTPKVVAGFDEADFAFLPEAQRRKLTQLVNEFRQIAAQVPPTVPANEDQFARALPLFRDIVAMLEFDRYGDAEAYRIGKQIEQAIEPYRPRQLAELRFDTGLDHTGDPGIWIWCFLSDEEETALLGRARDLRPLLAWASRTVAPDLFPYIGFRSVAEQAELLEADGK